MTIRSANLGEGMSDKDVEDLLEIIEEKGVGSAFEDQRKLCKQCQEMIEYEGGRR